MNIVKLTAVGESHTMRVVECIAVQGQYGEQVKFAADNGDTLFLPKTSADRQLERAGLTYASAVGATLTFGRSANPKKGSAPFWDVSVAGPPAAPSQRVQPPPRQAPVTVVPPRVPDKHIPGLDDDGPPDWSDVPPASPYAEEPKQTPREQAQGTPEARRAAIERHYLALHARVAAAVVENHVKAHAVVNVPDLATAISATTATIWITWKEKGLTP